MRRGRPDGRPAPAHPTLGVVIPALDEAEALPGLLQRLLVGSEPNDLADEVVVVDGGSRDGTAAVARAGGARTVEAPRGRGTQLAAGARELGCELLFFLHADCRPARGTLTALRRAFEDEHLAAAGCAQRVEGEGWFYRAVERAADARVRRGMVYGDSGLCARRSAYEAAGGFADLPLFEDVDLSRRLARLGAVRLVEGARLSISARRWEREGRLGATLRNWALRTAHALGADPRRLARLYRPHGQSATTGS